MATLRTLDGLRYGFKLLGLFLVVLVVTGLLVGVGGLLASAGIDTANPAQSDPLPAAAGGFVALLGVLWLYGASLGLLHKFVADSVATGIGLSGSEPAGAGAAEEEPSADDASAAGATAVGGVEPDDEQPDPVPEPDPADAESTAVRDDPADPDTFADEETGAPGADPTGTAGTDTGTEVSGEELDRMVSEATEPADDGVTEDPAGTAAGGDVPTSDPDPVEEDAYGAGGAAPSGGQYDDTAAEYGTESDDVFGTGDADDADTMDEPAAEEETVEGGEFEDIEDTTDEPGDWEPLDEDDL